MCLPVAKYKKIIDRLENEIYPSVVKNLDEILKGLQEIRENKSPVQLEKIQLTIDLKSELISLKIYETKLIFPQVLLLLDQGLNNIKIDFNQVLQLTNFKEEKIEKYTYQLQGLNNCHETVDGNNNELSMLVEICLENIQTNFLPLKRQWNFLLNALINDAINVHKQCGNSLKASCGGECKMDKKLLISSL